MFLTRPRPKGLASRMNVTARIAEVIDEIDEEDRQKTALLSAAEAAAEVTNAERCQRKPNGGRGSSRNDNNIN